MKIIDPLDIHMRDHYWQSGITAMGTGFLFYVLWNRNGYEEVIPSILVAPVLSVASYLIVDRVMGSQEYVDG